MPRQPKPTDLTINLKSANESAHTSSGPNSSPINVDLSSFGGDIGGGGQINSLPPLPVSPPTSPRHYRDPSKGFLGTFKTRMTPDQVQHMRSQKRQVKEEDDTYGPNSSSMSKIYHLRKNPGSTPELSLVGGAENVGKPGGDVNNSVPTDNRSQASLHHSEESVAAKRKEKPFRNPLSRSKSIRRDSNSKSRTELKQQAFEPPPKIAPIKGEGRDDMHLLGLLKSKEKNERDKSAERMAVSEGDDNVLEARQSHTKDKDKERSGFMAGSKNVVSRATKGGGNLLTRLGKIGRSGSNTEKDIPDSEYVLKIITLPLVEQTRLTRISKDLGSCRDKTEYWMPALPWRAIDFLNLNCESEGLYRVPGGVAAVKHWQRRFDQELDIDLLNEKELYDTNEISSMLKKWLTDLPNEMMPYDIQASLAAELEKDNPDFKSPSQEAPQKLRDALSELPPFNYYLLFAITCHLSLLLSHKDSNKMDLHNLSVCIGPCLKLERWLFNYLVGDWRHCWQGCFTEKHFLEAEKAFELGVKYEFPPNFPHNLGEHVSRDTSRPNLPSEERAVYSSGSSKPASQYGDARPAPRDADEPEPRSKKEGKKPETYRPAGYSREQSNGFLGTSTARSLSAVSDPKRPITSDGGKENEDVGIGRDFVKNPRQASHSRSKSDIPATPVLLSSAGDDYPFPMPGHPQA